MPNDADVVTANAEKPVTSATPKRRPEKRKVPPRRVYGDDFTVEVEVGVDENGEPLYETFYPHAGEWIEFIGSMTGDMYLSSLQLQGLRRRQIELRNLVSDVESKLEERSASGYQPSKADQAALDAAVSELSDISPEIEEGMRTSTAAMAGLIYQGYWTNSRGEAIGTPTGEHDDAGQPIHTFTADDLFSMEMEDMNWITDAAFGAMRGGASEKGSGS